MTMAYILAVGGIILAGVSLVMSFKSSRDGAAGFGALALIILIFTFALAGGLAQQHEKLINKTAPIKIDSGQ